MRLKKRLKYSAEAKWNHKTGGTAKLDSFTQDFDTPKEYGGSENAPCPDQLFMASLAGCIINTFNYFRMMLNVETRDLKVKVSSDITLNKINGYRVSCINVKILAWSDKENQELNQKCAERAKEYCHLTKSIESSIPIQTTIQIHVE
jgi:organic hydroperoxide reductase OsmC/OhrA